MITSYYIIAGIIGILIWQVITIIFYGVAKLLSERFLQEPEDSALKFAICVPYFILTSIDHIIGKCLTLLLISWCRKNLYRYCLCSKVHLQGSESEFITKNVRFFATKKMVEKLSFDNTRNDYVEFISDCTNMEGVPYGYYIYRGQDTFHGKDMNLFRKEIKVKEKENV